MDEPLELIGELMLTPNAQVAQVGTPAGEGGIGELGFQCGVVDAVELEPEK